MLEVTALAVIQTETLTLILEVRFGSNLLCWRSTMVTSYHFWSFAEKTFVKQSMMLCAFEILLKNGCKIGGNRSSMNLSSVVGHAWVVTRERPCRYKSMNLVS